MRLDADMHSILYVQCCFFIVLLLTPCLSPHLLTFGHCAPLPYGFLRLCGLGRWVTLSSLSLRWLWQQTLQKLPSPSKASFMCWIQGSVSRRATTPARAWSHSRSHPAARSPEKA